MVVPCDELYVCIATEITCLELESITSSGQMKSPYKLIMFMTGVLVVPLTTISFSKMSKQAANKNVSALIPQVRRATSLPLIAAGGIGSGEAMLAAMALGAEGVQIGTLFAVSQESSASPLFKQCCVGLGEDSTMLALKKVSPTRLIKNALYDRIAQAEARGAEADELRAILGPKASKRGIFEGDIENGELEIGQVVAGINAVRPVADIMHDLVEGYDAALNRINKL